MRHRLAARSVRSAIVGLALAAAASLLGVGGRAVLAIDPCTGYDLCVHVTVDAVGGSDGDGVVVSSPAGINCQFVSGTPNSLSSCDHYFHANFVTEIDVSLTSTPHAGSLVWCAATNAYVDICTKRLRFTASTSTTYAADFHLYPTVTVSIDPSYGGVITSDPSGITCSALTGSCSYAWLSRTQVWLDAIPLNGSVFVGWTGFCAGSGPTCSILLTSDVTTTAVFQSTAPPTAPPTARPTSTPTATATTGHTPHATPGPSGAGATPASSPGSRATPSASASQSGSDPGVGGSSGSTGSPDAATFATEPGAGSTSPSGSPNAVAAGAPGSSAPAAGSPASAVADGGADATPIIIAVLGAGLLVALSILGAAAMLRGRRRVGPG
jgi:hypothetical protein